MNGAERLLGEDALARFGSRVALVCGERSASYAELARDVARASGAVAALGVGPGDKVLLLLRDTPEFAAAWLGVVRAGAVAIALNHKIAEAEYRHILADSGARLAIVEDVFAAARPDLTAELAAQKRIAIAGTAAGAPSWRALAATAAPLAPISVDDEAPAFCLYSSGTTGRPKGIVHAHRAFAPLGAAFRAFGLADGERVFTTSKFFFAYGLEHGLLAPLACGMTALLHADWPDEEAVLAIVARHAPAALFSVPTIYRRLLAMPARLAALRVVRRFVAAGERLSPQLCAQWRAAVGGELLSLYGMSETFCACMVTPPGTSDGLRTGLPLDGVDVRLGGPGAAAPAGEPAVLWVRHPAQARGYENLPELTRAQFQDGWFCTRDLFVRDAEGHYVHQGRSDELVKIAGQWVQPAELEEAVAGEPAIAEAACVPIHDIDGLERLALFVTATADAEGARQAALAACERLLPRHKRPKWVCAVAELPRTATGKVQRFKLREILERERSGRA